MKIFVLGFFEGIGSTVIGFFEFIGGLVLLLIDALKWIVRLSIRGWLTLEQMSLLGVDSLGIILITTGFTGAVISLQLSGIAVKYGAGVMVGGGVAIAMARELSPMLTAIVFAGRAGSAITAEIGSMNVTEQIDALKAMATSPTKYLVVPRLIACAVTIPILSFFSILAGILGGMVVANLLANVDTKVFMDSIKDMLVMKDVWYGMLKSLVFAVEIALISCYQGLTTEGGAAGVGKSTTGSVVYSMVIVFITNYLLSAVLFPAGAV